MLRERGFDDRLVKRPVPPLAVEPPGRRQPFRIDASRLRRLQRGVVVEIELLHDDGGMQAMLRDLGQQARTNRMMRGIVMNLAEQPVARRREIGDERRFGHEALRMNVVDARAGRRMHEDRRSARGERRREQGQKASAPTR